MTLHEFYTMGGYALYVWPAFALVAVTLGIQWVLAHRHQRKTHQKIKDHLQA